MDEMVGMDDMDGMDMNPNPNSNNRPSFPLSILYKNTSAVLCFT